MTKFPFEFSFSTPSVSYNQSPPAPYPDHPPAPNSHAQSSPESPSHPSAFDQNYQRSKHTPPPCATTQTRAPHFPASNPAHKSSYRQTPETLPHATLGAPSPHTLSTHP